METVKPTRNVLVAVDVQHDFIDGSLAVAEGEQVVAPLNTIAETMREFPSIYCERLSVLLDSHQLMKKRP